MSRRAAKIEKAEEQIAQVQSVLGKAQDALETTGRIDESVTKAAHRTGKLLKLLVALGLIAVIVIVVRRLMAASEPVAETSTEADGSGLG